jgi:hypothetical protein
MFVPGRLIVNKSKPTGVNRRAHAFSPAEKNLTDRRLLVADALSLRIVESPLGAGEAPSPPAPPPKK